MQVYMKIKKTDYIKFYKQNYEDKNFIKETFNSIIELKQFCKDNSIILLVHILPELNNVNQYPFWQEEKMITEFIDSIDVNYIQGISYMSDEQSR